MSFPYPPFPTGSLAGSFPSFPTYTFAPSLPQWLGGAQLFSIQLPDIAKIPQYIIEVFLWIAGYGAAYLRYAILYIAALAANGGLWIADEGLHAVGGTINYLERINQATGIFAPVITAAIIGGITAAAFIAGGLIAHGIEEAA